MIKPSRIKGMGEGVSAKNLTSEKIFVVPDLISTSRIESKFSPVLHLAKDEDLKNILGSKWP